MSVIACSQQLSNLERLGGRLGLDRMTGYSSLVQVGESAAQRLQGDEKACHRNFVQLWLGGPGEDNSRTQDLHYS